jgi:membrane-bound serine protease (ClpP class)
MLALALRRDMIHMAKTSYWRNGVSSFGEPKTSGSDPQRPSSHHKFFARLVLVSIFSMLGAGLFPSYGQEAKGGIVYVIPIQETIDLGLAFFVKRSLQAAERAGAAAVVLDVNTFGGRVDAAVEIRDALDECEIPTTAYINKRAISAGALICLATDKIAMAPGSTIGAATPVGISGPGQKMELGEKEKSYVRGEFRATAERNGHSPLLAAAMVDPDIEALLIFSDRLPRVVSRVESEEIQINEKEAKTKVVSEKGKLLTLTTSEAVEAGLAGPEADSLDSLIASLGYAPANKFVTKISWSEYIVRFLTHPVLSGLLLTFGVLGIFFELKMPGWGVSGSIGVVCLLLFFGGHYLAGLASALDLLLFAIGLILLALEIFVVPGFGLPGIAGLSCIFAGIYLAMVKRPVPEFSWDYQTLNTAMLTILCMAVAVAIGIVIIWKMAPESRLKQLMVLSASEQADLGYTASENLEALVGQSGKSLTHLRPAGKALIGDEPIKVQSQGEFIEKNSAVTVVRVAGNKVFVAETDEEKA